MRAAEPLQWIPAPGGKQMQQKRCLSQAELSAYQLGELSPDLAGPAERTLPFVHVAPPRWPGSTA